MVHVNDFSGESDDERFLNALVWARENPGQHVSWNGPVLLKGGFILPSGFHMDGGSGEMWVENSRRISWKRSVFIFFVRMYWAVGDFLYWVERKVRGYGKN